MFPFPRTLPRLSSGALAIETKLLSLSFALSSFMKDGYTGEMVFPDVRATFTDWLCCNRFGDFPRFADSPYHQLLLMLMTGWLVLL